MGTYCGGCSSCCQEQKKEDDRIYMNPLESPSPLKGMTERKFMHQSNKKSIVVEELDKFFQSFQRYVMEKYKRLAELVNFFNSNIKFLSMTFFLIRIQDFKIYKQNRGKCFERLVENLKKVVKHYLIKYKQIMDDEGKELRRIDNPNFRDTKQIIQFVGEQMNQEYWKTRQFQGLCDFFSL